MFISPSDFGADPTGDQYSTQALEDCMEYAMAIQDISKQTYYCSVCNVRVILSEGRAIRPCPHKDASVIAPMTAHATGVSQTKSR